MADKLMTDASVATITTIPDADIVAVFDGSTGEWKKIAGANMKIDFTAPFVQKAVDYTLTSTDRIIEVTATGKTITVPSGVSNGKEYTIKLTASGSCTVSAAANIDGASTYSLSAQYKYVQIKWNGTTWLIIANN